MFKKCKQQFCPLRIFPDGEGYMYVRPLLRQKPCPRRFTFRGGWKSVRDTSPGTPLRTPLRTPPPYSTDRGGNVKIVKCPQAVCKLFVRCLRAWGCTQPMSEVHSSLQKVFEKEGKTKIDKCNHTRPEAYNSLQKVLKNKVNCFSKKTRSYT